MFTKIIRVYLLIVIASVCCLTGSAQNAQQPKEPAYVENKAFQGRVFEIKYRDPIELAHLLEPMGSGFKGAAMSGSRELKSVSVRDFPENIVAIEAAIKRLDVAATATLDPDVEIEMHLLMATNIETSTAQIPAGLKDVVQQLQKTLNYKNYHLLTSIVQRAKIRNRFSGKGVIDIAAPLTNNPYNDIYSYAVNQFYLSQSSTGVSAVQLDGFNFNLMEPGGKVAEIATSFAVREGEKVVVGAASLRDKAMILVLSIKVVK